MRLASDCLEFSLIGTHNCSATHDLEENVQEMPKLHTVLCYFY